jgi:hypothetical protein
MRPSRLAVLAIPALLMTSCGSKAAREVAERSPNPVVAAAAKSADPGTAHVTLKVTATGSTTSVTGEGVVDLVKGDDGQVRLVAPGPDGPEAIEIRVVKGRSYESKPHAADLPAAEVKWVKLDDGPAPAGPVPDPVDELATGDPTRMIHLVESASDFTKGGPTEVGGDDATTWTGTIDLAKVVDDDDRTSAEQLRASGLALLPTEVAIDGKGRLRRVSFTIDLAKAVAASGQQLPPGRTAPAITYVLELDDFGAKLSVKAPPADQIVSNAVPTAGPGAAVSQ